MANQLGPAGHLTEPAVGETMVIIFMNTEPSATVAKLGSEQYAGARPSTWIDENSKEILIAAETIKRFATSEFESELKVTLVIAAWARIAQHYGYSYAFAKAVAGAAVFTTPIGVGLSIGASLLILDQVLKETNGVGLVLTVEEFA